MISDPRWADSITTDHCDPQPCHAVDICVQSDYSVSITSVVLEADKVVPWLAEKVRTQLVMSHIAG